MADLLIQNGLACPDSYRLHRKISELRLLLAEKHTFTRDLILNTRAVGYSMSLNLKKHQPQIENFIISNTNLNSTKQSDMLMENIYQLLKESLEVSNCSNVIMNSNNYILDRQKHHNIIDKNLSRFENLTQNLIFVLKLHSADFIKLRIELIFSKIATYIGLSRISDFDITLETWCEHHQHESNQLMFELQKLLVEAREH